MAINKSSPSESTLPKRVIEFHNPDDINSLTLDNLKYLKFILRSGISFLFQYKLASCVKIVIINADNATNETCGLNKPKKL